MNEKEIIVVKVRWYLRYKTEMGWSTLMTKNGIRYFDSFTEMSSCVAARIDANPNMQFQFIKETYGAKA